MANQYFENNAELKSDIKPIKYYYKHQTLTLFADNGVFSKGGIDFGSNLLLKNVNIENAKKILDVGCGYGTIGLPLAATNNDIEVSMVDVNLRAIELSLRAAEYNSIKNVKIFESNMYEKIDEKFDLIITNPPIRAGKKIVYGIILDSVNYLNDGGKLWCVIQKKQGAPSALKALSTVFSKVEIVESDKGYCIIKATK